MFFSFLVIARNKFKEYINTLATIKTIEVMFTLDHMCIVYTPVDFAGRKIFGVEEKIQG